MISNKALQRYFVSFNDPTTQLGSTIQGPNTDSDGCLFFHHHDRHSGSSFIYYIFRYRIGRVCLLVCLFVCLFLLSTQFFFFFLCFLRCSDRHSGSSLSTIFIYYSLQEQIRFNVEWSPWEHRVQQHPGGHRELPRLCRQERRVVLRIQDSKLRVCLSLCNKAVFDVFPGKAQPSSSTLGSTDTATLDAVDEHKWLQAN